MELHPEELQLSGDEESQDAGRDDQDKGLKIRRTVTQVWTDSLLRIEAGEMRDSSCCDLTFQLFLSGCLKREPRKWTNKRRGRDGDD